MTKKPRVSGASVGKDVMTSVTPAVDRHTREFKLENF